MIHNRNVIRNVIKSSLSESAPGSIRELGALFEQSPNALVFADRELRLKRTNAAFRRLVGLPDEVLIGRRPTEIGAGMDTAMIERTLAEQVMKRGVPVVDVHLEQVLAGQRRDLSWSAYRVTENGQAGGCGRPHRRHRSGPGGQVASAG
jgi:PAS domain S-box-containing protein